MTSVHRTQGHGRKPQLEAQQSEAQRPGEDVGASLHPWGMNGCRYASERGEPTGRSTPPSHRSHRPAHHPINDTREASQLSDPSPHRGALQPAQRRRSPNTRPSKPRWACLAGLRPSPLERPIQHRRLTPGVLAHDAGHRGDGSCYRRFRSWLRRRRLRQCSGLDTDP